jgi:hypothetical protein
MRIFKNFNSETVRSTVKVLSALLGLVAANSVYARDMIVVPTNPVAKLNAATTVEVRFDGKVLGMSRNYVVCAPKNCTMLTKEVKLYDGSQLLTPTFNGPLTCGPDGSTIIISGVQYVGCANAVLKVTIPAKSKVGNYTYTVTHDDDTYGNSTTVTFVVSVRAGATSSTILPLLLD